MRIHFELGEFDQMTIEHNGVNYPFSQLIPLAEKRRLATNISEYVYKLPTNKYVYVTVVGEEEQPTGNGIYKGWYIVEDISKDEAKKDIDLLSEFTAMYK